MIYYINVAVPFNAHIDKDMMTHPPRWLGYQHRHSQYQIFGDYTYYQGSKEYRIWGTEELL